MSASAAGSSADPGRVTRWALDRWAHWRLNLYIFRTALAERLTYRGDFAFATLIRFLPLITQVFLWGAVFEAGVTEIHQYRFEDMVAYSLLVMLGRAFSSMPGLTTGIARDVREGTIKKFLIQPVDLIDYLFWHRVAHKLAYYVVATLPFALVFYLCRGYFRQGLDVETVLAMTASLVMSFWLGFLLELSLGLCSFWFLEVSSLVFVYMLVNYFLSGHMLPLDWLPEPWQSLVQLLPFKYLAYVPAAIGLGRYSSEGLLAELALELAWVVALSLLVRWQSARGIRRYSAYGG